MKIAQICRFVLAHAPYLRKWGRKRLRDWIGWHVANNTFCLVLQDKKIVGFACARPLKEAQHGNNYYELNPLGSVVFVDLAIARTAEVFPLFFSAIKRKLGEKKQIAFFRGEKNEKIKIYDLTKFEKKLKGLSHGITT